HSADAGEGFADAAGAGLRGAAARALAAGGGGPQEATGQIHVGLFHGRLKQQLVRPGGQVPGHPGRAWPRTALPSIRGLLPRW
ncbi:unnamed protein product, partial [Effrenium voratum]